ncbi:GntR family transcriptional regulator [Streptomyces sp. 846.5]|nr:GntR family transcriptional regulator [Streptomyces sp. 846.5]TDU06494.1 GntR family transcriptional regulator [Streptomyces sp. 846.5]
MAIIRNEALYKQVAAEIRDAIYAGEYPPGRPLPSETDLMASYNVSRPTVRQAVSMLRAEGLLDVIHGKGSFVRSVQASGGDIAPLERTITKSGQRYILPAEDWAEAEPPAIYRAHTDRTTAPLLAMDPDEALFACDRLLVHQATGTRALHRILLPMASVENTPLADAPDTPPAQAYAILATAGHKLTWRETVRTRLPQPDERTTLQLPEATPILVAYRTTCDADDQNRPLILEETRIGGDRGELTYTIHAEIPKRGNPGKSAH